jgi:hypothetical protein
MSNGIVESIKKFLEEIDQGNSENEHSLETYIKLVLNDELKINSQVIDELAKINNSLTEAICEYLKWQNSEKKDFSSVKAFFAKMEVAIKRYYKIDFLFSYMFELLIGKRIQFKMFDELEVDLNNYLPYFDNISSKLFIVQHNVLKSFTNAFIVLVKNSRLSKNRAIGEKVFAVVDLLSKSYCQAERRVLQRKLLNIKNDLNKILLVEKNGIIQLAIANSYESEGDNLEKKEAGLGLTSYAYAFIAFLDLGNKDKFENVKSKLKTSCQNTRKRLKKHQIGSFSISAKFWISSLIPAIKYYDVLGSISNMSTLFPSCRSLSSEEIGVSIKIFPFVVIDDENNVSAILEWNKEPEECMKYQSYKGFEIEETKHSWVRSELFRYLVDTGLLELNDFIQVIDSSPIDNRLKESIKYGLSKFFSKDFVSSSYVLTLQIEPLIIVLARLRANVIAINQKSNRRGATQETTLGNLLSIDDVKRLFTKDYYNLLQLYFTYDLGFNYRNKIAHGLIDHSKLGEDYNITILLMISKLLSMMKKSINEPFPNIRKSHALS